MNASRARALLPLAAMALVAAVCEGGGIRPEFSLAGRWVGGLPDGTEPAAVRYEFVLDGPLSAVFGHAHVTGGGRNDEYDVNGMARGDSAFLELTLQGSAAERFAGRISGDVIDGMITLVASNESERLRIRRELPMVEPK